MSQKLRFFATALNTESGELVPLKLTGKEFDPETALEQPPYRAYSLEAIEIQERPASLAENSAEAGRSGVQETSALPGPPPANLSEIYLRGLGGRDSFFSPPYVLEAMSTPFDCGEGI